MDKVWLANMPHSVAQEIIEAQAEIIGPALRPNPDDFLSEIDFADAALVSAPFPGIMSTFERAKKLRVIVKFGIGTDNIDLKAATNSGICVINTPDAPTEATAEFTIGMMLAVIRHISFADRLTRMGCPPVIEEQIGMTLKGKDLGLVGLGRIGMRVAEIAQVLGMRVSAYDPYVEPEQAIKKILFWCRA